MVCSRKSKNADFARAGVRRARYICEMVIIIGAGLAGLTCAKVLHENGVGFSLLEAAAEVGGRVATKVTEDGFYLDRGFQVLLDSYPAVRKHIDLPALQAGIFDSGALFAEGTTTWRAFHPWRHPSKIAESALGNYVSFPDKMRLTHLAAELMLAGPQKLLAQDRESTGRFLEKRGFSTAMIERFFRPFFGGVLVDNDLATSAGLFQFYFQKFIFGRALLPAKGIQEIPRQLASHLPSGSVESGVAVERCEPSAVFLKNGERRSFDQVVIATSAPEMARLLQLDPPPLARRLSVCYFSSLEALYPEKLLVLPTGKDRVVRHFSQVSNVCPSLAPAGRHLLSATVLVRPTSGDLFALARAEIAETFPAAKSLLEPLEIIEVPYAVPDQPPGFTLKRSAPHRSNLWIAGDHTLHGSIQGAMESGERTAREILQSRGLLGLAPRFRTGAAGALL